MKLTLEEMELLKLAFDDDTYKIVVKLLKELAKGMEKKVLTTSLAPDGAERELLIERARLDGAKKLIDLLEVKERELKKRKDI